MKKKTLVLFFLLVAFHGFSETYGQTENRFKLWYTNTMIQRVNNAYNSAIDDFNKNKTRENYLEIIRCGAARQAYWAVVRDTAEILYELFGELGDIRYNIIFESASDNFESSGNILAVDTLEYRKRWPNADEEELLIYVKKGFRLFSDYFNTATRQIR